MPPINPCRDGAVRVGGAAVHSLLRAAQGVEGGVEPAPLHPGHPSVPCALLAR